MTRRQSAQRAPSPAARITAAIVARLEAGTRPWVKPWRGAQLARPLRACGTPYRGINVFWLWLVAENAGHVSPYWMTFNQARRLGGQVRKGEKATVAVFYKSYARATDEAEEGGSGPPREETRRALRSYPVFNAGQVAGLPVRFHPAPPAQAAEPAGRRAELDRFFDAIPAAIRHHGDEAYYEPLIDRVTMPPVDLFTGYDHYYATLAHELSHWTGHGARLGRDLAQRFGSAAYAAEELIAELSSAMLGAELGLPVAHLDHHASYIDHWLALLRADDRAIMTAAARAEEASALLLSLGGREPVRSAEETADA